MNTHSPHIACRVQLGETSEGFVEVREGINSYIEGVNKTMSGLTLLNKLGRTSLMDNMMFVEEQLLDVELPAELILHPENSERIIIPKTTWLITQTVERVVVPRFGSEIVSSGHNVISSFARSDLDDNPQERDLFENADLAFGNDNFKEYEVTISALDFLYTLYNPGQNTVLGYNATLKGFPPNK